MGLCGMLNVLLAIGKRRIDIGATAELNAKQHLDRVVQLLGQIYDRCVKADELCREPGSEASTAAKMEAQTTDEAIEPD